MQITGTDVLGSPGVKSVEPFDDRKPIHRLRRKEMVCLADIAGIEYPQNPTKDLIVTVLEMAQDSGVDFRNPDTFPAVQEGERTREEALDMLRLLNTPPPGIKPLTEMSGSLRKSMLPTAERTLKLEDMGVFELRSYAKQRGHKVTRGSTRAELLEMLSGEDPS